MKVQQQGWYIAGGDMVARAGFSLAMCGAVAGLLFLTAHNGSDDGASAAAAGNPAVVATVVASFADSAGVSPSQTAIDASPFSVPLPARIPIPVERVAEASPAPAKRPPAVISKPARPPSVAVASNMAGFESCLPGCETRDPLVVGHARTIPVAAVVPATTDELVGYADFPGTRPSILGRALDAPGVVYRRGRHVLTAMVEAAL